MIFIRLPVTQTVDNGFTPQTQLPVTLDSIVSPKRRLISAADYHLPLPKRRRVQEQTTSNLTEV